MGLAEVRGRMAPVVDLRVRFGIDVGEAEEGVSILVVDVFGITLAFYADEVLGIHRFSVDEVLSLKNVFPTDMPFLLGLVRRDEDVVALLDVAKIFDEKEVVSLLQAVKSQKLKGG